MFRRSTSHHRQRDVLGDQSECLISLSEPDGQAAEAFRALRTNLLYSVVDTPPGVIVLTSPGSGEGKSTICANLGVVLALANRRTLVIDCDFRKPVQHKIFGLRNFSGAVNVLAGECEPDEASQEGPVPDLSVMTVGPIPPNPAELLGSRRFAELMDGVRQEFEYVLVDAPPTRPVSDPMILASQADGVLLVVDSRNTRKGAVRWSMRSLQAVGANVLGTVMNQEPTSTAGYYGGYAYAQAR